MRMRHKPWADDFLAENADIAISNPADYKGKWNTVFGNDNPIHIEVGTGKGQFISGMAKQNPDINYIGIELFKSVIVTAVQKVKDSEAPNVKLLNIDADTLTDVFEPGEVKRVYLNFSDPWPKKRHEKRRLTYSHFLMKYEEVMGKSGAIHFKTDNRGLFEYSLKSFSEYGLLLTYVSLDLHNSDMEDNIMTEYEEKFSALGQPIYRAEVEWRA
ncbi:tRNA (guanosine(46)-N7)-methyltransferase TrmB [Bacillus mojavensis]|uniref:tRNA (guanosine(46)-N7)-methyltransferase TrmB n=1 Tax=Bacillus mojavensis TaxID=72360 RepID=UPI002DB7C945|nr:tRNA (guanosine(46)-N7)-methyltransferase TrmB [Bacillus mojavensis]MEC1658442.1 tRNA (guanosine(46)-N7)-methyltransferase TrmB [Bacillus mojavensis]MEC1685888.1 tRNA (guanosine(46)-N7)-methyltransferase TrmB [Bacillus mojavensis]MEC1709689.1 tRNA (guanosine(46)-N7)-methyltransferase TrmB [Bacillus mojavensis]